MVTVILFIVGVSAGFFFGAVWTAWGMQNELEDIRVENEMNRQLLVEVEKVRNQYMN